MNNVQLIGRLTRDGESRTSTSGVSFYRNAVAVDRKGKDAGTDFFNIVAFGKSAEFMEKYFRKGSKIGVTGHLQSGKYKNKDGIEIPTVDVVVDSTDFCESRADAPKPAENKPQDGFLNVPEGLVEELPFT